MGIKYRRVDISTDPEARDYVMALGYLQPPSFTPAPTTTSAVLGPIASRRSPTSPPPDPHHHRHPREPAMHQLTIDHHNQPVTITDHPNFDTAHRALLKYVVGADYYLCPVRTTAAH